MFFGFYFFDSDSEEFNNFREIVRLYNNDIFIISYITNGTYEIILDKREYGYEDINGEICENRFKQQLGLLFQNVNWDGIIRYIPNREIIEIICDLEENRINETNPRLYIFSNNREQQRKTFNFTNETERLLETVTFFRYSSDKIQIKRWNKEFLNFHINEYNRFINFCLNTYRPQEENIEDI